MMGKKRGLIPRLRTDPKCLVFAVLGGDREALQQYEHDDTGMIYK